MMMVRVMEEVRKAGGVQEEEQFGSAQVIIDTGERGHCDDEEEENSVLGLQSVFSSYL